MFYRKGVVGGGGGEQGCGVISVEPECPRSTLFSAADGAHIVKPSGGIILKHQKNPSDSLVHDEKHGISVAIYRV